VSRVACHRTSYPWHCIALEAPFRSPRESKFDTLIDHAPWEINFSRNDRLSFAKVDSNFSLEFFQTDHLVRADSRGKAISWINFLQSVHSLKLSGLSAYNLKEKERKKVIRSFLNVEIIPGRLFPRDFYFSTQVGYFCVRSVIYARHLLPVAVRKGWNFSRPDASPVVIAEWGGSCSSTIPSVRFFIWLLLTSTLK